LTLKYPTLFKGFAMIAPFFKGYTDFIDKYSWPIRFFNLLQFYCSFSATNPSDLKKYAFYY
jgi:hypothetical protein